MSKVDKPLDTTVMFILISEDLQNSLHTRKTTLLRLYDELT